MRPEQPDLLDYPRTPGWRDVDTSIEAAEEIAPRVRRLRGLVFAMVKNHVHGLTADEVAERCRLTPFSIRPRLTELKALGLIVDSGGRRQNESGRRAIVWVVAEPPGPDKTPKVLRPVKTRYERRKGR